MATTDADSEVEVERKSEEGDSDIIDVTDIWPGRFTVEIEMCGSDVSTTTTLALDAEELRALGDRIDSALAETH
jgi:hypothetical protein